MFSLYCRRYSVMLMCVVQILPALREECEESAKCKAATEHFRHCEERVNAGKGYKGEDCVEEL